MEALLEVDSLDDALSGSLEIIVNTINSEAGAIWLLDPKTDRLSPLFHIGPADVSNITVENGLGIEGLVTKTGKSVMATDAAQDARFDGTVFDDNGLVTKTMICVPLNNLHEVIGCVQIVNKKDGSLALDSVSDTTDVLERDTVIFPKFHREKCIGCGRCVVSCADGGHQAIRLDENRRPLLNGNKCAWAAICACWSVPRGAVSSSRKRISRNKKDS